MNIESWERNCRGSSSSQIFFKIGVLANFTGKNLCWSLFLIKTCKFIKKRLQNRCHEKETTKAVVRRYSSKKVFLKISHTGKYLCWSLFLMKLLAWRPATLLRRDCNTCVFLWNLQIFKNIFITEHLRWLLLKLNICFSCQFITY